MESPLKTKEERIADALERIATEMEQQTVIVREIHSRTCYLDLRLNDRETLRLILTQQQADTMRKLYDLTHKPVDPNADVQF
jgi:hypothetical protein